MATYTATLGGILYNFETFTVTGAFTWTPPAGVSSYDSLLVGGGGGGGLQGNGGGGGGAGGVRWLTGLSCTPGVGISGSVGTGGTAGTTGTVPGGDGGNSSLGANTALGGGGAGAGTSGTSANDGRPGGSGGGGSGSTTGPNQSFGGAGTAGQGSAGGRGFGSTITSQRAGGGGGGAGGAGATATGGGGTSVGGDGGLGFDATALVGTGVGHGGWFGSGGGGGCQQSGSDNGDVTAGGGGRGGWGTVAAGDAGMANTGGGGGGSGQGTHPGGAGGSGVVIVRWLPPTPPGIPTTVSATPGIHTASLAWSAPAGGGMVTSYEVRKDGGAASIATSPHLFTGLTGLTGYDLEVRAVGPGGSSAWVLVHVTTLAPTELGYYRVELSIIKYKDGLEFSRHDWDLSTRDTPELGPQLPIRLGWVIPDQVEFFPAMPDPTTLTCSVLCSDASELEDVAKGDAVTFAMYVDADLDAEPWQSFQGVVTQLDGEAVNIGEDSLAFRVTVYAGDDNMRLADMTVGYTAPWPIQSIYDRVDTVATEAGFGLDTFLLGTGLAGWLAARTSQTPTTALAAIRDALKDAADEYDSEIPDVYYGRYIFQYDPAVPELVIRALRRRVFPDTTVTLDGCLVEASGRWSKLPGPADGSWVLVDGTDYGTTVGPPLVRNTNLLDYTGDPPGSELNYSAQTRDNLGQALLPDGSTQLTGWYARALNYRAARDDGGLEPTTGWANGFNQTRVQPVVITPLGEDYELQGVDYVAGTLTGCALVIPPGGDYYLELRLRPELLDGTELP